MARADAPLRLFVALALAESTRAELADYAARAGEVEARLRPVNTESLHVTLCFLGSQPAAAAEAIGEAVGEVCAQHRQVALRFGEPLWLPRRGPRALAISLRDAPRLGALQLALAARLQAGGWYRPERRPYLAHVTVARVRSQQQTSDREMSDAIAVPTGRQLASTVTLLRSLLGPGGARYETLARASLLPGR